MNTNDFLLQLSNETQTLIRSTNEFLKLDNIALNIRPSSKSWSIAECYHHLNLTLIIYLPQIQQILKNPQKFPRNSDEFKHSIIGKLAFSAMQPKSGKTIEFKMKTFKKLEPNDTIEDSGNILSEFLNYQHQTLDILEGASAVDLKRPKINTAIGPILKMGIGDALHFMVAHNQRHVLQAKKVLQIIQ